MVIISLYGLFIIEMEQKLIFLILLFDNLIQSEVEIYLRYGWITQLFKPDSWGLGMTFYAWGLNYPKSTQYKMQIEWKWNSLAIHQSTTRANIPTYISIHFSVNCNWRHFQHQNWEFTFGWHLSIKFCQTVDILLIA